ncbi:MAG: hypothetical protein NVS9B3_15050 [Gemmatimonadaceae bacterium]
MITLLRRGPMTVGELAVGLDVTGNAVRAHLSALEDEALVERGPSREGATKPAYTYVLTAAAAVLLSRAYAPVLTQLLDVLSRRLGPAALTGVMRDVGRGLAQCQPPSRGTPWQRAQQASAMLNALGGMTEVEDKGAAYLIRGTGCPLAAATTAHPEACAAVESLLTEFVGTAVRECCDRAPRPSCCFEVGPIPSQS